LNLDERLAQLRSALEAEVERVRRETIEEISRAVARMRAASSESGWHAAVLESGRVFASQPAGLELIASLAALTAPASSDQVRAGEAAAQRFAKVKVAEIQLYQAAAVKTGRAARDLYSALQPQIDAAREAFQNRFLTPGHHISDYLHVEMVRALANDDATLLGPEYPGPLAPLA
jgi:hypothetical protein